jgi:predicted  nucleic acid-binding Zn-ribbon protein
VRQYLLDLYEIQKIDLSIRDQEKRQESLPARLRDLEQGLAALQTQIHTLTEQRVVVVKEAQALRNTVDEETQKIRKWESRLNDIRNQREYQALSRETEGSKRANRDADEKISQLHAQRDAIDKQLEVLKTQLTAEETACATEKAEVEKASAAVKNELVSDQTRRDTLVPRVPKSIFRKYDAIRARRLGVGLCPVVSGCCTGCNMRLPPQLYNTLQRGDSIEQCPSCHRLIFWDQILPSPEEVANRGTARSNP